jgi:hypothetical protein
MDRLFAWGLALLVLPTFMGAFVGPLWIMAVMGIGLACTMAGLLGNQQE